tara:strand:+ start:148 stop:936 length:789 start_codon:yes stop_codon:yes gene_type:complete
MGYLTSKKIYPGDMTEPLNGWYQNINTPNGQGPNNSSFGGPTSVLANPGWRFFQLRGYVQVANTVAQGYTAVAPIVIPSPYKNDETRVNITGMKVTASVDRPVYVYRASISVASGWDGNVAQEGLLCNNATQVVSFGPGTATTPTNTSGVVEGANLVATNSGIAAGTGALGTNPFQTATTLTTGMLYKEYTAAETEWRVYAKATTNGTATAGGWAISNEDAANGRFGYIITELCYIQPDEPVDYNDISQYLPYKIASNYPGY